MLTAMKYMQIYTKRNVIKKVHYKNQSNTKEGSQGGNEGQKAITYTKSLVKWQREVLISNYIKYKWIKSSKGRDQKNGLKKHDSLIMSPKDSF